MTRIIHNFNLPYQKISWAEKNANNKQFFKNCINGIVPLGYDTNYDHYGYRKMLSNYRLYNNIMDPLDDTQECGDDRLDVGQKTELRVPYNIAYRKVNKILGEARRRGLNTTIYLINELAIRERDDEIRDLIRLWVEQQVQYEILKAGDDFANLPPEQQQQAYQQLVNAKSPEELDFVNYLSERQIANAHILNLIIDREKIELKKIQGMKHVLIGDTEAHLVYDDGLAARVRTLNPLHTGVFKSPETQFYQDGVAAYTREAMYREDVLETYGADFTEEEFEEYKAMMVNRATSAGVSRWTTSERQMKYYRHNYPSPEGRMLAQYLLGNSIAESVGVGQHGDITAESFSWVVYAQWRGYREVLFVTSYDRFGQKNVEILDVDFELPRDATRVTYYEDNRAKVRYEWFNEFGEPVFAEYEWIARTYEGTRIDDKYFVRMREVPNQFTSADNPYESRLDFIGCTYTSTNAESVTYLDRIRPFNGLYQVVMDKIKFLIANERGMLSAYDTSQLDSNLDDPETGRDALEMTRYYELSEGSVYYNSMTNYYGTGLPPTRPPGFVTMPKSNASFVAAYMQIADWIELKAGLAGSINPSREGTTQAREAVRNVQSNVMNASDETDYLFYLHDLVWQDVLYCAIQKEKRIWKRRFEQGDRFVGQYVLRPSTIQTFKVKGAHLDDSDIGLFVNDSRREQEFQAYMMQAVQNMSAADKFLVGDITTIIKALTMQRPINEIEQMIRISENRQTAQKQQEGEAQRKFELDMQVRAERLEDLRHQRELEKIIVKVQEEGKIELQKASIVGLGFSTEKDTNNNNVQDIVEQQANLQKANNEADKIALDKQRVAIETAKSNFREQLK